jgi:hypothetical protein
VDFSGSSLRLFLDHHGVQLSRPVHSLHEGGAHMKKIILALLLALLPSQAQANGYGFRSSFSYGHNYGYSLFQPYAPIAFTYAVPVFVQPVVTYAASVCPTVVAAPAPCEQPALNYSQPYAAPAVGYSGFAGSYGSFASSYAVSGYPAFAVGVHRTFVGHRFFNSRVVVRQRGFFGGRSRAVVRVRGGGGAAIAVNAGGGRARVRVRVRH